MKLDKILGTFTKTITELESLHVTNSAKAVAQREKAVKIQEKKDVAVQKIVESAAKKQETLTSKADALLDEAAKAVAIMKKLEKLVS